MIAGFGTLQVRRMIAGRTLHVNYNIQTSFKRNRIKKKWDLELKSGSLLTLMPTWQWLFSLFLVLWIADLGLNQTAHRTKRVSCWVWWNVSLWWTTHLPTEVYSAKQRIPYMGWMLLSSSEWICPSACGLPCLAWFTRILTFELQLSWPWLACLSLLATEPIPDIRWRRTRSWRDMHPTYFDQARL